MMYALGTDVAIAGADDEAFLDPGAELAGNTALSQGRHRLVESCAVPGRRWGIQPMKIGIG